MAGRPMTYVTQAYVYQYLHTTTDFIFCCCLAYTPGLRLRLLYFYPSQLGLCRLDARWKVKLSDVDLC